MPSGLRDAEEIGRWTEETDVLVVGLGCAGACAALEAAAAGAETLVLERGGAGGGIRSTGLQLDVLSSTIDGNTGTTGGGIHAQGDGLIHRSTIAGNQATTTGGGLQVESGAVATVESSTLSGNTAATGGGFHAGGATLINGSTVTANIATAGGGGYGVSGPPRPGTEPG